MALAHVHHSPDARCFNPVTLRVLVAALLAVGLPVARAQPAAPANDHSGDNNDIDDNNGGSLAEEPLPPGLPPLPPPVPAGCTPKVCNTCSAGFCTSEQLSTCVADPGWDTSRVTSMWGTSFAESSVGGDRSSLASSVQSHDGGRSTDGRSTDLPEVSAATQRLQRVGSSRTAQLHAAGGATSPPVFAQVASLGRVVSVSSCAGASGDAFEVAVDVDAELRRPSVEPPAAPPAFV